MSAEVKAARLHALKTGEPLDLPLLSIGGVAANVTPVQPKKYKPCRKGEVSSYGGAGVLPCCVVNHDADGDDDGKLHVLVLLQQRTKGKQEGFRWMDCGGNKKTPEESAAECAGRKFAKQTYGLFGIGAEAWDMDQPDTWHDQLQDILRTDLSLLRKATQQWTTTQLLYQDPVRGYYHDQLLYHTFLVNVPYVPSDLLNAVSHQLDDGKHKFRWLDAANLSSEPLAQRLHINQLLNAAEVLNADEQLFQLAKNQNPPVAAPCTVRSMKVEA